MNFNDYKYTIDDKIFKIKANHMENKLEITHAGLTYSTSFKSIIDADDAGYVMRLNLCGDDFEGRNEYLKKLIAIKTVEFIEKLNCELEMLCNSLALKK